MAEIAGHNAAVGVEQQQIGQVVNGQNIGHVTVPLSLLLVDVDDIGLDVGELLLQLVRDSFALVAPCGADHEQVHAAVAHQRVDGGESPLIVIEAEMGQGGADVQAVEMLEPFGQTLIVVGLLRCARQQVVEGVDDGTIGCGGYVAFQQIGRYQVVGMSGDVFGQAFDGVVVALFQLVAHQAVAARTGDARGIGVFFVEDHCDVAVLDKESEGLGDGRMAQLGIGGLLHAAAEVCARLGTQGAGLSSVVDGQCQAAS